MLQFLPLIGAGISALGSLFAPKPKPQTVTNSIDLAKLRADAEANGFNPLTIIRGGGLAGYGVQNIPAAADTRLSDALMTFGSGLANFSYDPYGEAKSVAELRLAEAQIKAYGREGVSANMFGQTPKASGVSGFKFWGGEWNPNPNTSDAQDGEARYGELGELLFGLGAMGADAYQLSTFKGDVAWRDLTTGVAGFAKHLGQRRTAIERERSSFNGHYTGGGF